ncbi:hypothetical protein BDW_08410 [Bdellovibrio bacteriovorus W]|nr:hypothetical protein BDW_08410 [Bdellovibrio bacteriovorus W]
MIDIILALVGGFLIFILMKNINSHFDTYDKSISDYKKDLPETSTSTDEIKESPPTNKRAFQLKFSESNSIKKPLSEEEATKFLRDIVRKAKTQTYDQVNDFVETWLEKVGDRGYDIHDDSYNGLLSFVEELFDHGTEEELPENSRAIQGNYIMEYSDIEGNRTKRTVTIKRLLLDDNPMIVAYCHLRKEPRTFRVDRIISMICSDTGEIHECDLLSFLTSKQTAA